MIINTPEGTRDRLFAECQERRQVQARLTRLFRQRGFLEVSTPDTEFYDLFALSGSAIPQERMIKVWDPSGKFCVMRPDSTTPIARVAATKLKAVALPQRLYYDQTVYRSNPAHNGGSREIPQCGVELIGAGGKKADVEIIVTAIDALRSCGAARFHVELGHAGSFRELAGRLELGEEAVEEMRALIEGKNFAALNAFLEPHRGNPACAALERLSRLFGGAEVLSQAEKLAGKTPAVDYLSDLYDELSAAGYGAYVRFDLGMVHQIDYYTGVVFRGYVEGAGDAVLSGGRYDNLVPGGCLRTGGPGHRLCRGCGRGGPYPAGDRTPGAAHHRPLRAGLPGPGSGGGGRPPCRYQRIVPLPHPGVQPEPGPGQGGGDRAGL